MVAIYFTLGKGSHVVKTLLVVDDYEDLRKLVAFFLRPWLCSSRSPNCSDGHPRCDEGNPNLILLDLRLADMNGIEVARQLQNSGNNTHPRHCLDCGLSSPSRIARPCSDQAYSTVFQKPVSLRELEATVARCLYPYRMIPKEHLGRRRPADKFFRERLRTAIPNFAPLIQKRPFCDILTTPAPFTKRAPKLSHA